MAKRKKAKKKAHGKKRQNGPADVDEHVLDRLYLACSAAAASRSPRSWARKPSRR